MLKSPQPNQTTKQPNNQTTKRNIAVGVNKRTQEIETAQRNREKHAKKAKLKAEKEKKKQRKDFLTAVIIHCKNFVGMYVHFYLTLLYPTLLQPNLPYFLSSLALTRYFHLLYVYFIFLFS